MDVNGGISNYADDVSAEVKFAAGTGFMGGRAHVEMSGEFESDAGVNSLIGPRKWYENPEQLQMYSVSQCQPNGCPGGGPMWVNGLNGEYALFSRGGMITNGPLQGTAFGAGGTAYQFNYGYGANGLPATPNRTAAGGIAGCSPGGYCLNGDTSGDQMGYASMVARLERGDTFTRFSYDLTPNIELYSTIMYSEVVTWDKPTQDFYKAANLNIGCDNPYFPK
jgi:iron complex outermembrane recepter protein